MTENHVHNYCARTALLLRMLEGDLAHFCSEHVREEIRRILHYVEAPLEPSEPPLAEADE
jgi:hypothetical protein